MLKESEAREKIIDLAMGESALKRVGQPEDLAYLVSFLASDRARHITGEVIKVDGGNIYRPLISVNWSAKRRQFEFLNDTGCCKFEARNPKSETNPNDEMTETQKKQSHLAAKFVLVIFLLNI